MLEIGFGLLFRSQFIVSRSPLRIGWHLDLMSPMLDQLDWDEVEKKIESVQMHGGQWAHGPGWVGSDAEAPSHLLPDQLPPLPPTWCSRPPRPAWAWWGPSSPGSMLEQVEAATG